MMKWFLLPSFTMVTTVSSVNLFVASYTGSITTLSLTQSTEGQYTFSKIATTETPGLHPLWQEKRGDLIYVCNDNLAAPNGSISSYKASATGQLTLVQQPLSTQPGPVSTVIYNQGKALAAAHYSGSAVTSFSIGDDGILTPLQSFVFKTPPGPRPQQDVSHPHQVVLDPSGKFIVVPDLGSDLLRIFSIDDTNHLTEKSPVSVSPGSGPRHGAFLPNYGETSSTLKFFLISELSNTVSSFAVAPSGDSISFTPVSNADILNKPAPEGLASAELQISPDGRFMMTSARNATLLSVPSTSSENATEIPSDTLQSWAIDSSTGGIAFQQLTPAGGRTPRHFSTNQNGTMVAVALQGDGRVVVFARDASNGSQGPLLASIDGMGEALSIVWDEYD
ncbi:unnamed protein product [Blumeria hordei]|uniref:6-phosphogluconolactonase n=2 Tax=Blumeria hordei TaxID=2867405 RepID=A0A383USX6_BLUHO|nr:3-carboxymuconate cyclase [Blumeria hordei DH14]SZF03431.1 unnamed protein product [Blumeria hordei]